MNHKYHMCKREKKYTKNEFSSMYVIKINFPSFPLEGKLLAAYIIAYRRHTNEPEPKISMWKLY